MFSRNSVLAAALTLSTLGFAAAPVQAQTYFGVQSTSQTLGYTGTYNQDSGWLAGASSASTAADPAGATLYSSGYATLYADVASSSDVVGPELRATATSHASVVSGSNIPPASVPYGHGYGRYYDRLTVKSTTLPAGTPVTLVFGNDVTVTRWDKSGGNDGYVDMTLQIGAGSAHSRWSSSSIYGDTDAVAPQIQIKTTVGAKLTVDAKLRVQARAFYQLNAAGNNEVEATARIVVRDIPAGVTLQADSGAVIPFEPGI